MVHTCSKPGRSQRALPLSERHSVKSHETFSRFTADASAYKKWKECFFCDSQHHADVTYLV